MDPSHPQLSTELLTRSISLVKLLYSTPQCMVYEAFDGLLNSQVALKLQTCSQNVYERMLEEVRIQANFQHTAVVRLYTYFSYWISTDYLVLVLEMELLDLDLAEDISNRRNNAYPYEETEIWNVLHTLVDVLSSAQLQSISHRDIKPANIMLSKPGVKLGDFGSAKRIAELATATVIGTPIYLSPVLRLGLSQHSPTVTHNSYKSDVYSLGMTILHMALLQPPMVVGSTGKTEEWIGMLPYSDCLKETLRWMLGEEETRRPDFVQLNGYFQSQNSSPFPLSTPPTQHIPPSHPEEISFSPIPPSSPAPTPPTKCTKCGHYGTKLIRLDEEQLLQGEFHQLCLQDALLTREKIELEQKRLGVAAIAFIVSGLGMIGLGKYLK